MVVTRRQSGKLPPPRAAKNEVGSEDSFEDVSGYDSAESDRDDELINKSC